MSLPRSSSEMSVTRASSTSGELVGSGSTIDRRSGSGFDAPGLFTESLTQSGSPLSPRPSPSSSVPFAHDPPLLSRGAAVLKTMSPFWSSGS